MEAIEKAGYKPGEEIALALDVAASELADGKDGEDPSTYSLAGEGKSGLRAADLIGLYTQWLDRYPLVSIETARRGARDGWKSSRRGSARACSSSATIFTNPRSSRGNRPTPRHELLVKVNQIGTLTETLDAVELAKTNAYANIMSHRSGETEDTTIADLAVATGTGQIKTGAPCRSDRVAKYNRLLRIAEELEGVASYPGARAFPRYRR